MNPIQPIFKVSEFNEMINAHLGLLGDVTVEGEISEIKVSKDSWLYITLKDDEASVQVFGTLFSNRGWRNLEVGMLVRVTGYSKLYAKFGKFSLNAKEIVPAGEGSLRRAFEKLKAQLEVEGLFNESHKRELPKFPARIGLLTAENSQAYNDFVKVLRHRMGGVKIFFYPVHVQGNDSVSSIVRGISYFNETSLNLDAIALIRGGGSLEDLQSFNDERVARVVYGSKTPIMTGVGHEGDVTLVDFVADVRASTPSNCAELLVPDRASVRVEIERLIEKCERAYVKNHHEQKEFLRKSYAIFDKVVISQKNRYSTFYQSLIYAQRRAQLAVDQAKEDLESKLKIMLSRSENNVAETRRKLDNFERVLGLLHHENILQRGFSITRSENGDIIRDRDDLLIGATLLTQLHRGTISSIKTEQKS